MGGADFFGAAACFAVAFFAADCLLAGFFAAGFFAAFLAGFALLICVNFFPSTLGALRPRQQSLDRVVDRDLILDDGMDGRTDR